MAVESKEKIKDRMLKTAARLWNMPEVEVESSFDPIVKLMLDACSYELERIHGDMESSQSRMIEKMVEVILPDALIGIRPSSAILFAQSSDKEYLIPNKKHFISQKRVLNPLTNVVDTHPITFSAIGNFKLHNASVKWIATGNKLLQVKDNWYKDAVLQSQTPLQHKLILGIEVKDEFKTLQGLNLYFDARSEHNKDLFYHALRLADLTIQGKEIKLKGGMYESTQFNASTIDQQGEEMFQYNQKTCQHIYALYDRQFLHISDDTNLKPSTVFPNLLVEVFSEQELKKNIQVPLLWLEIDLGATVSQELLDHVFCQINCFPVINRKQHELTYKTQKYINIIPIESKEYFFDIRSITGSNHKAYHKRNLSTSQELNNGEALVRSSGVGRFDSREARDTIHFLLQVIRDETSTFADIGGETIAAKMKELNQVIARIEDQMKRFQKSGSSCYIMLKPSEENETIFVEYYTCVGKIANDLKMGTKLTQEKGSEILPQAITLLTPSLGGKDKLNFEEKLNLFRKYLLAKNRIVSAEDVRILCFQLLGATLKDVQVNKGVMTGIGETQGFTRCVDVTLYLQEQVQLSAEERDYLLHDLEVQLNQDSSGLFPYRVQLA